MNSTIQDSIPQERYTYNSLFDPKQKSSTSDSLNENTEITFHDDNANESPIKKNPEQMSSDELLLYIDSLITPKKPKKHPQKNENDFEPKHFNQKIQLTKKIIKKQNEKKEIEESSSSTIKSTSSSINQNSAKICNDLIKKRIECAFGNHSELTKQQIEDIFTSFGILEGKEKANDRSLIRDAFEEWKIDDNIYDANVVKSELLLAVNGDIKTKFRRLVRDRINVKLVNKKVPRLPYVKQEEYQGANVLSRSTFTRLKKTPSIKSEEEKPEPMEYISKNSQEILSNSVYDRGSFLRRANVLDERRKEHLQKIAEDLETEFENSKVVYPHLVHYSDQELNTYLEALKFKRISEKEERKPLPLVMPYEEYAIYRDYVNKLHKREKRPPGWDNYFKRMEDAKIKKQLKIEEEEKYSHLEVPIIKMKKNQGKISSKDICILDDLPQKKLDWTPVKKDPRKPKEPKTEPQKKVSKFYRPPPPGLDIHYHRK